MTGEPLCGLRRSLEAGWYYTWTAGCAQASRGESKHEDPYGDG